MSECTLIFPHQLFDPHPAVAKGRAVVLIEDGLFFGDSHVDQAFHLQKLVLHRASMKAYADLLVSRGYEVRFQEFKKGAVIQDHMRALVRHGFQAFHCCEVVDFLLEKRLQRSLEGLPIEFSFYGTPGFLSSKKWLEDYFGDKVKRPMMASFYRAQRQRLDVLVEPDGEPVGGKWSLDAENRKPMPKRGSLEVPPLPPVSRPASLEEAVGYLKKRKITGFGDATTFAYPTSHRESAAWLDHFLEHRFHLFGDYEDAISGRERVLFHGVLTPMLNVGLLTPKQILDRSLEHAAAENIPLNCLEGFVRQVIGWREFVRGIYEFKGVAIRNGNFWGFADRPIPGCFYEGTTGIEPIDCVIKRVLGHGWCHHIERLMILGNFMLLCGFHPERVCTWFMELFVDAYDWVMVPNVYGMSQFADGGTFTTKPYISGSNYVRKMSDFPKGDWCAIWDGLFWSFIEDHEAFFRGQHRLAMMTRQLDRMDSAKRLAHRKRAQAFLESIT